MVVIHINWCSTHHEKMVPYIYQQIYISHCWRDVTVNPLLDTEIISAQALQVITYISNSTCKYHCITVPCTSISALWSATGWTDISNKPQNHISMAQHATMVTPLLMHWSCQSLELSHQNVMHEMLLHTNSESWLAQFISTPNTHIPYGNKNK